MHCYYEKDEEFRFEVVDDSLLQNTPVEFKVIDQDIYSSELIGVVYIDLNPLIMRTAHGGSSDNTQKDLVIEGRTCSLDSAVPATLPIRHSQLMRCCYVSKVHFSCPRTHRPPLSSSTRRLVSSV